MSKAIFVSCVYEDSHRISTLTKWVEESRLGNVVITHETEDKRTLGKDAIKKHIKAKIEGAAFILILVGNDTHNHDWITAEVELANSFHKKIVCVRIPNSTGAVPPILKNYTIIPFEPNAIQKELQS